MAEELSDAADQTKQAIERIREPHVTRKGATEAPLVSASGELCVSVGSTNVSPCTAPLLKACGDAPIACTHRLTAVVIAPSTQFWIAVLCTLKHEFRPTMCCCWNSNTNMKPRSIVGENVVVSFPLSVHVICKYLALTIQVTSDRCAAERYNYYEIWSCWFVSVE